MLYFKFFKNYMLDEDSVRFQLHGTVWVRRSTYSMNTFHHTNLLRA